MPPRKRYVRISVDFHHGRTKEALLREFGPWGPLLLLGMLAQAKNGRPPGSIRFTSDQDLMQQLGYDLEDFLLWRSEITVPRLLKKLGQLKQTRTTRVGRVTETTFTRWEEWQEEAERYADGLRKACKRASESPDKRRTDDRTDAGQTPGPITTTSNESKDSLRREVWDALDGVFGKVTNDSERGKRAKAVKLLLQSGATGDETRRRFRMWGRVYPTATPTEMGLANNWSKLAAPKPVVVAPIDVGPDVTDAERRENLRQLRSLIGRSDVA